MPVDPPRKRWTSRRWWPVPLLTGALLALAVLFANASTAAPQAATLHMTILSTPGWFAAYPDIAIGDNGLVAVAWTEGTDPNLTKQNGPLHLAWTSNSLSEWMSRTVSLQTVYDVAVAVDGTDIHLVWSVNKTHLYHAVCKPPNYTCSAPSLIAVAPTDQTALQLDLAIDGNHIPHVVWVEGDDQVKRIFYSRQESGVWLSKQLLDGFDGDRNDSESPALTYADNMLHMAWIEWQNSDHTDSTVNYCQRGVGADNWPDCRILAPLIPSDDYRARNPSIAADGTNVYVVWDFLSKDDKSNGQWQERTYAIGYQHSSTNGTSWLESARSYPRGEESGTQKTGTTTFGSSEGHTGVEWTHYLRPHISLAASGTLTVPVLVWHAKTTIGGGGEGYGAALAPQTAHKIFWDYATQPGGKADGTLYWAGQPITLSMGLCSELNMEVDSATGRAAVTGDLGQVLSGGGDGSDYLHVVYHEQSLSNLEFWQVIYNNQHSSQAVCYRSYLPLIAKNAESGSE